MSSEHSLYSPYSLDVCTLFKRRRICAQHSVLSALEFVGNNLLLQGMILGIMLSHTNQKSTTFLDSFVEIPFKVRELTPFLKGWMEPPENKGVGCVVYGYGNVISHCLCHFSL